MNRSASYYRTKHMQFSLKDLFANVTLCCLIAAASQLFGIIPAFCLMAFSLALAVDLGPAALAVLVVASLAADLPRDGERDISLLHQFMTILLAAGIAFWHRARRSHAAARRFCPTGTASTAATGSRTDHSS